MTEGKPKRSYWRRGPRKKKGAEDPAGTAAATPAAAEGDDPTTESEAPGTQETGGPIASPPAPEVGEAGFAAPSAEAAGDAAESAPGEMEAGSASAGDAPPKGRRRSRRRGKKKTGDAAAPEPTEEAGETPAPVPPAEPRTFDVVGWGGLESPARAPYEPPAAVEAEPADGEPQAVPAAGPSGSAAEPGAEPGGEPGEPGKRRRRRRRRRRGKGKGPAQGEAGGATPAEAGDGEPEADDVGALAGGGTEAEEPEPESERMNEADEEEEESFPDEGTGAKKVMLIDGLHSEENRVAIVAEGNLDYYEVENQRRKAFKGNIYKAKVVNIAHAIEAAFVEFGGGRHGFMPLNEYCAGALMEHLGTWNEGDKRPPLRPGMEILVQVTKEESSIKGAAVTSYISIAGRYMVMMLGMKRYGISKKITGEKERERIRKQMEKLEYPDHLGFIVRTVGAARPVEGPEGRPHQPAEAVGPHRGRGAGEQGPGAAVRGAGHRHPHAARQLQRGRHGSADEFRGRLPQGVRLLRRLLSEGEGEAQAVPEQAAPVRQVQPRGAGRAGDAAQGAASVGGAHRHRPFGSAVGDRRKFRALVEGPRHRGHRVSHEQGGGGGGDAAAAAAGHRRPDRHRLHRHGEQVPQQGGREDPEGGAEAGQGEERRHLLGEVRARGDQPAADGDLLLRHPPQGVRPLRGDGRHPDAGRRHGAAAAQAARRAFEGGEGSGQGGIRARGPGAPGDAAQPEAGRHQPARETVRGESGVPRGSRRCRRPRSRSKTGRRSSVRRRTPDR